MPLKDICANCKFFRQNQPQQGICTRYPPAVFPSGRDQVSSVWPVVRVDQGCGEFKPKVYVSHDLPVPVAETRQ